jgi:uncharacterized membrane-anchored protein YitT (DUF2179 family)
MFVKKSLYILIGSILVGVGINLFIVPHELLDGGALGIALVFHYLTDIQVGLAIIFVSLPIFFFAFIVYRPFFINGIHGMLFSSLIIDLLYPLHIIGEKYMEVPIVSAIIGGVFVGAGIGVMLLIDTSIGGTDLLAQMVAKYINYNPGVLIFIVDLIVVLFGSILIASDHMYLSFITVTSVGITSSVIVGSKKGFKLNKKRSVLI